MTKETPWWKKTPVAAPDAQRAIRPPPDEPEDADDDADDDDDDDDDEADDGDAPDQVETSAASDIPDGETVEVQGSGAQPYILRNVAGVYSCSCPAWRNQSAAIERRSCKHLRKLRGDAVETARVGTAASTPARRSARPAAAGGAVAGPSASGVVTAPPILLAHPWDHVVDLTGWWMSEKLDGVRAYWDGTRFLSRLGNQYHAPDWFTAALPEGVILDGELWAGRKKFQRGVSIARRQDKSDDWRELSYVIFDAPAFEGPFEQRLAYVRQLVEGSGSQYAVWHPHEQCTGLEHLRGELARVEELGGEGLMMRQPSSRYEVGRSWTLRKVKTFHDAEARVIAHVRGAGRHGGRLGSLQCELPDGTVFNVGTGLSDAERNDPPAVGTIVTFRYQELSNDGVPRFPSYVGARDDVAWPPAGASTTRPRSAPVAARPAAARPGARAAPAATAMAPNRRSFTRGDATWAIELEGRSVTITASAPDSAIETTTRHSANFVAAWRDADRLIAEILRDGYVEIVA